MITFTPLAGGAQSSQTTPLCYLLQVDDVRILLDCGSPDWNLEELAKKKELDDNVEDPWDQYIRSLESIAYTVDLVLLSHGDLSHTGLIPYAYSRWNLRAPSYCTLPVQAMARIAAVDHAEALRSEEDIDHGTTVAPAFDDIISTGESEEPKRTTGGKCVATVKQIHEAFDSFTTLRYSQPIHLQGYAGHTLGGTIWKIRSPSSGTIIYAVDLNHTRERHLDGTVILRPTSGGVGVFEPLGRPDLLITDAERALVVSSRRKDRDSFFLDTITSTLRANSLLIPCDSSTRLLELLVLLDQHWSYSKLKSPICLISNTGAEMLTFVRSMMEWLGGTVSKEDLGEDGRKRKRNAADEEQNLGAFALRFPHLEFFSSPAALTAMYPSSKPKLILAVPASLSHGPSRALFADFASTHGNTVLLTSRAEEGTLSNLLFERWNQRQDDHEKWDKGNIGSVIELDETITIKLNTKVPLQGTELEGYLQGERAAKEREAAHQAALVRTQMMLEADEDDSDSDDSEIQSDNDLEGGDDMLDQDVKLTTVIEPGGGGGSRRRGKHGVDGVTELGDWAFDQEEALTKQLLSYDIYLKGNVSRTTSFFKTTAGQTQRFRMFPYIERKRRVDSYGETVDVGMWLRKGKALEEYAETEEVREAKRAKLAEEEMKKAVAEPPSKFVSHNVDVKLACKLCFVDMEGLNDGRALKTIVPQVNPRKMIIVHASSVATESLIDSCGAIRTMTKEIYAPALGDSCQIGQHTDSFSISLSDELLASIKMSTFEDNEVGFVVGRVASHATSSIPTLEPTSLTSVAESMAPTVLDNEPAVTSTLAIRPIAKLPQSTMIGDLKLTALKGRLARLGVPAEFAGEGVLVCGGAAVKMSAEDIPNDTVAVRKTGRGKVVMEGTVSDVYYVVRREIYNLHALIAT
ncbi:beta-lactamase-like protein [Hysterangium stoloniferum]|nr:beta-lactamase-like protein [Hysterangium stoloniferum]